MNTTAPEIAVKHHIDCGNQMTDHFELECSMLCGYNDTPFFDYNNQVWIKNGVYLDCNHPKAGALTLLGEIFEGCNCYGRQHAGEPATV